MEKKKTIGRQGEGVEMIDVVMHPYGVKGIVSPYNVHR